MGRLSLVLADQDIEYLTNFEKYLMINYPQRFDIYSFSSVELLNEFLVSRQRKDILLIHSQLYNKATKADHADTVLLLSDDCFQPVGEEFVSINKYQHMDKLISEILRHYTLKSIKECTINGHGETRIISVLSPCGGSGKSSIAAGCSVLNAENGNKTFYLNLEDTASTNQFFHNDSNQSISNVIFHLKGKGINLSLKMEGCKCIDTKSQVHYFKPPENMMEMNELASFEVDRILDEFKKNKMYHTVFVDMSSSINSRNAAVLKHSDLILLILTPESSSNSKYSEFKKGLELLEDKWGLKILDRIIPILNKVKEKTDWIKTTPPYNELNLINEIKECTISTMKNAQFNPIEDITFLNELSGIIKQVISEPACSVSVNTGGEYIA